MQTEHKFNPIQSQFKFYCIYDAIYVWYASNSSPRQYLQHSPLHRDRHWIFSSDILYFQNIEIWTLNPNMSVHFSVNSCFFKFTFNSLFQWLESESIYTAIIFASHELVLANLIIYRLIFLVHTIPLLEWALEI